MLLNTFSMCNKSSDMSQQVQPGKRKKLTSTNRNLFSCTIYFLIYIADVTVHFFGVSAKYMNIRKSIYN